MNLTDQLPRQDRITKVLIVAMLLTTVLSWAGMIWMTLVTYEGAPPLPERILSRSGETVMTRADLHAGKAAFQKADLMDYGSLYGMGAYFGEDYTATGLVKLAEDTEKVLARQRYGSSLKVLDEARRLAVRSDMQAMLRGIDLTTDPVVVPDAVAKAIERFRKQFAARIRHQNAEAGYTRARSLSEEQAGHVADFIAHAALTTVARRPGKDYSWTANWPPEPIVENQPTKESLTWTVISFGGMILGIGIVLAIYRVYIDREGADETYADLLGDFQALTPSQRALGKFFTFVALVLLLQIGTGAILGHYYAEREGFYGLRILGWLPFNWVRDIHVQTPIVWIGLGWIASALFLAPRIGGREPKAQKLLVDLLFIAVLVIVVGALFGDYAGVMGWMGEGSWFWFGNQGLEYLQLGRFWQILFFVGLAFWSAILLRAMWPTLRGLFHVDSLFSAFRAEHLLWYSSLGIAVIYIFGMIPLTGIDPSFTINDFWRWWVVHLWVEWAFELFSAAVVGYFLMAIGLVSRQLAERVVLFEWILILGSGILGTGHHMFWAGEPATWLAVGSVFSFLEVLPLFLLVLDAVDQRQRLKERMGFPYRLAFLFILGSVIWNFVGAGVFGGIVNAPLINYYEHATFLTMNHAHTAMFGAFGMLALGLIYLSLRYMVGDRAPWSDTLGIWAFWLYNVGLVMWVVMTFLPVGFPQLEAAYTQGLAHARSLAFYGSTVLWQWLRTPGDIIFAIGALLMAWDFLVKLKGVYWPRKA
jgi:nitric oxide reductase subunit B